MLLLLFFVIAKKRKTKLCYRVQVGGGGGNGGVQLPEKIPNLYYYIYAHAVYNRIVSRQNVIGDFERDRRRPSPHNLYIYICNNITTITII